MSANVSEKLPFLVALGLLLATSLTFFIFPTPYIVDKYTIVPVVLDAVVFAFVLTNFLLAWATDPGNYPKMPFDLANHVNDLRTPVFREALVYGYEVKMKWCDTCKFYRPPRCTHCSSCNHCVEEFDHHCPWVDNCIGRRNYRHFFAFLSLLNVHIVYVFVFSLLHAIDDDHPMKDKIASIIVVCISGLVFLPVVCLLGFHIFLVMKGRTTNEQVTGKFRAGHNPFTEGWQVNCLRTLCLPVRPNYLKFEAKTPPPVTLYTQRSTSAGVRVSGFLPNGVGGTLSALDTCSLHIPVPAHHHSASDHQTIGVRGHVSPPPALDQSMTSDPNAEHQGRLQSFVAHHVLV